MSDELEQTIRLSRAPLYVAELIKTDTPEELIN